MQVGVRPAADVPLAPQEGLLVVSQAAECLTEEVSFMSPSTTSTALLSSSDLVLTATGSVSDTLQSLSSAALHTAPTAGLDRAEPPLAHISTAQTPGNQSVEKEPSFIN